MLLAECLLGVTALGAHKFTIGQTVSFTPGMFGRNNGSGTYKVVRLLPYDGSEFQYRIKGISESHERVARESQLEFNG
ncbi:MAG: hypothetical protein QOD74_701 [Variibacter sp.]|nr:hypothetical protein [Variibacter sp.]